MLNNCIFLFSSSVRLWPILEKEVVLRCYCQGIAGCNLEILIDKDAESEIVFINVGRDEVLA